MAEIITRTSNGKKKNFFFFWGGGGGDSTCLYIPKITLLNSSLRASCNYRAIDKQ